MREMKDSGVPWIGEIPKGWALLRTKNQYRSRKLIVGDAASHYERLALTLGGVIKRSKDDSTGLQPDSFEGYQVLHEGELVFKLIDLENLATSRVGYSPFMGIVSPAYVILHPNESANARFGEYYFLSLWHRAIFNSLGDNGVRSNLNAGDLLNIPYVVPSSSEQKRIVDYLDNKCVEIDSILENTHASIEEYKALKLSIITEAVTKGIRGDRLMKESGVEWIGEIPAEWDVIKIKRLLKERNDRSENGDEEPLSMSQKFGIIPTKELDMVPNMASSFVGAKLVYKGDLVFNKLKAHLGVFAVSEFDGLVSPDYAVYYSAGRCDVKYLERIFKTPQYISEFRKRSTGVGAGLTRLYTSDLFDMYTALPTETEQKDIAAYLDKKCAAIDSLIASKEALIVELEAYKKSIIYEYVTGKKEVL